MGTDHLDVLRREPDSTGIFLDFDGTLSEIVDHPEAARPVEGATGLLGDLARVYRCVAIVSGRSAHQLLEWLGPSVEIHGLHGAERTEGGRVILSEEAERYSSTMLTVAEEARSALGDEGLEVEDKGVMLGLHYRRASDPEAARRKVEDVARSIAERHGLKLGRGRMVVELRPPLGFSKASVVRQRAEELKLESVAFAGDDIVDLPAFNALDDLEKSGVAVVRIGVESREAPSELLDRSDVRVEGPKGVVKLLRSLLA